MQKEINKVNNVVDIKEVTAGVFLKFNRQHNLSDVLIQAYLVDENYTKKEFIPQLSIHEFVELLGVYVPHLKQESIKDIDVLIPFSKGGNLHLDDDTYIEFHIINNDGTQPSFELHTYENFGKSEPLVIQPIKLDENISTKDIDVNYYDFFVSFTVPNELQALGIDGRVRFEKQLLEFDRNARMSGFSHACKLGLSTISQLSVYKNSGEEYEFYLLDIF